MVLIYIISRNNNSGGGGRYDDDDDVIITRRGRKVYPGGFFPFPTGGGFGGLEVLAEVWWLRRWRKFRRRWRFWRMVEGK